MSISSSTGNAGDLHLEHLTKTYERTLAVDGIDLDVRAGRYVALLGPSGCGKTTTLRMIAGFERPTSGRILLGEDDLTRSRPHERPINTVFQSYALFPHLDVLGNVAFGPRRRKVKDAETRARQALDLVQLGALARRRPAELSGGEQQRVALARALVNDPAVLLLDEPLGALDLRLRRAMQDGLKELQHRLGTTFLHVTHDQEEALTLADEVAVMRGGRIEQYGSPQQVYELPQTAFVATFLGRALLAPARRVGGIGTGAGEAVEFAVGSAGIVRVPADRIATAASSDSDLLIGIRPERVRLRPGAPVEPVEEKNQTLLATERPSPYGLDLIGPGTVTSATFTGPGTAYQVAIDGLPDWQVLAANDGVTPRFAPGDIVHLVFDAGHAFAVSAAEFSS
ncbi:ABC transporter ATP-binding protein [Austwickia chelonae]|uniref:ABC transporter ATP-binding protein n=1 Tax=Austwickia chelonae TaxID=100225 RepID=UPI000E24C0ED|nr:ABC transporter ATP-binding protein [Austwickia chelonae]